MKIINNFMGGGNPLLTIVSMMCGLFFFSEVNAAGWTCIYYYADGTTSESSCNGCPNVIDDTMVSCVNYNQSRRWKSTYDENGRRAWATRYAASDVDLERELEVGRYVLDSNDQLSIYYSYFCNGHATEPMWGITYYAPESGCTEQPFVQKVSNGSVYSHRYCGDDPNHADCVEARSNYCSPYCSSCANGVCSACYGGRVLQDNMCVAFDMPEGCLDYSNGACKTCDNNHVNKAGSCISPAECNGHNYIDGYNCKEMPSGCATMSGGKCSSCEGGYLEKNGDCVDSSTGCGAGYKDMGGFCNRVQYTPAEAAEFLTNDNKNTIMLIFKK